MSTEASGRNLQRIRAVFNRRRFRELFFAPLVPRRWLYRWIFMGENGDLRQVGEHVLADLRDFARLNPNQLDNFHTDHAVMAYRAGKQAVVRRIFYFLNLDEEQVQKLMEIDDGL